MPSADAIAIHNNAAQAVNHPVHTGLALPLDFELAAPSSPGGLALIPTQASTLLPIKLGLAPGFAVGTELLRSYDKHAQDFLEALLNALTVDMLVNNAFRKTQEARVVVLALWQDRCETVGPNYIREDPAISYVSFSL